MAQITVHSTPNCRQCKQTKKRLTDAGVAFVEVDLAEHPELIEQFKAEHGITSAPVVTVGGKVWGGYQPDLIDQAIAAVAA